MSNYPIAAIRLTRTPEAERVLKVALSRLVHEGEIDIETVAEVEALTSQAIGLDYLSDPEEDVYQLGAGKKVSSHC